MTAASFRLVRRVLWGVATVATMGGVAAMLLPAASHVAPLPPTVPEVGEAPALLVATAAAEEVVLANIFAEGRTPPPTRYQPPDLTEESADGMMAAPPEAMPGMPPDSAALAGEVPRLFGTVVAPSGPRALLQLSLATGPRLYGAGDRDGGYTVLAIDPGVVVLRGPGGRRTLRLEPED